MHSCSRAAISPGRFLTWNEFLPMPQKRSGVDPKKVPSSARARCRASQEAAKKARPQGARRTAAQGKQRRQRLNETKPPLPVARSGKARTQKRDARALADLHGQDIRPDAVMDSARPTRAQSAP